MSTRGIPLEKDEEEEIGLHNCNLSGYLGQKTSSEWHENQVDTDNLLQEYKVHLRLQSKIQTIPIVMAWFYGQATPFLTYILLRNCDSWDVLGPWEVELLGVIHLLKQVWPCWRTCVTMQADFKVFQCSSFTQCGRVTPPGCLQKTVSRCLVINIQSSLLLYHHVHMLSAIVITA